MEEIASLTITFTANVDESTILMVVQSKYSHTTIIHHEYESLVREINSVCGTGAYMLTDPATGKLIPNSKGNITYHQNAFKTEVIEKAYEMVNVIFRISFKNWMSAFRQY